MNHSQAKRIAQKLCRQYLIIKPNVAPETFVSIDELAGVLLPLLAPEQTVPALSEIAGEVSEYFSHEGKRDYDDCDNEAERLLLSVLDICETALKVAPVAVSTPNPAPVWKREKPVVDGYYWYRFSDGIAEPVLIRTREEQTLMIDFSGQRSDPNQLTGSWYGPLVAPGMDGGEK